MVDHRMELIEAGLQALPDAPLRGALATDTGRHREHNEDAVGFFQSAEVSPPVEVALLVADGVGGHEGGQQASRFVVDAVRDTLAAQNARIDGLRKWMDRLLHSIHQELLDQAVRQGTPSSMGSTATVAAIQDRVLTLAHVGDSRAYRLRNGHLEQLTHDHSWVAEQIRAGVLRADDPEADARKNVLTQCLGIGRSLEVQTIEELLSPGDRYLLCSDGLHGVVDDAEIRSHLAESAEPADVARRLIDLANERGGPDNISAVVFDIGRPRAAALPPPPLTPPAPEPERVAVAPISSRRAAPWMTGVGAVLLMVSGGAWMAAQVSARATAGPAPLADTVVADSSAPVGDPMRLPAATPSTMGADPTRSALPDTGVSTLPESPLDSIRGDPPVIDRTIPDPEPDSVSRDTLSLPDTLPHPRPE